MLVASNTADLVTGGYCAVKQKTCNISSFATFDCICSSGETQDGLEGKSEETIQQTLNLFPLKTFYLRFSF